MPLVSAESYGDRLPFHVEYLKIYLGNAFIAHLW